MFCRGLERVAFWDCVRRMGDGVFKLGGCC